LLTSPTVLPSTAPPPLHAQPFSQRHPSYLSRYTSTMEPHILDVPQQVVAMHKVCVLAPAMP